MNERFETVPAKRLPEHEPIRPLALERRRVAVGEIEDGHARAVLLDRDFERVEFAARRLNDQDEFADPPDRAGLRDFDGGTRASACLIPDYADTGRGRDENDRDDDQNELAHGGRFYQAGRASWPKKRLRPALTSGQGCREVDAPAGTTNRPTRCTATNTRTRP